MIDLAQADRTLRNTPTGDTDPGIEQRHRARCEALRADPLPFTTKKAALATLTGADKVRATQVGGFCFEDWEAQKNQTRLRWESQGATVSESIGAAGREQLTAVLPGKPGTAAYITRAALTRVRVGKFTAKAARYAFTWGERDEARDSSGSVPDLKLSDDGHALELTMFSGAVIRYTLEA